MRKGASAHELSAPFVDGQQAKRAHKDHYQKHNPIKKGSVDQRFQQDGLDRHRVQKGPIGSKRKKLSLVVFRRTLLELQISL